MSLRTGFRAAAVGLLVCCGIGVGYLAGAQDAPKRAESTLNVGEVLRVGDRIVTAEDLIARIHEAELGLPPEQRLLVPSLIYLRDAALFDLEAERLGLVLTPEETQACAEQQINFAKDAVKRAHQGVLPWKDWLKENYGMTEQEFEAYVRERAPVILRRRVLVNHFLQTTEGIEVWHILVSRETDAEKVYDQLSKAPAPERPKLFEELAVQKSEDRSSNLNRGKIGRIFRNAWYIEPAAAEAPVWALRDGEVAKPIKSAFGWHVFLRRQTFTPPLRTFEQLRPELIKAPDVDGQTSNTWVLFVRNSQKYRIEQRVPGIDCKPNQKGGK